MSGKYNTIIFDLDGTLLNTLEDITDSVNHVLEKYGEPVHSIAAVRGMVGNGLRKLMERAVPGGESCPGFEDQFAEFKAYYTAHSEIKTGPYAGVRQLMAAIRDMGMASAIVTNKAQEPVDLLVTRHFQGLVDTAVGEGGGRRVKPAPDSCIEAICRLQKLHPEMEISPQTCLYLGDSEVDAATAENSGMDYVLVSWGFRDRSLLETFPALAVIDEPAELLTYIKQAGGNMRKKKNIALTGFMGVGKSTVAACLKESYGYEVADTDAMIEAAEGKTISRIFAEEGEEYFRQKETKTARALSEREGIVISCGGGLVMRTENVEALKAGGVIVLLSASPQTIYERVKDTDTRPLLRGNMNPEYIEKLMSSRLPKYMAAADMTVDTDGRSVEDICAEIVSRL